jgi:hypothetical protein
LRWLSKYKERNEVQPEVPESNLETALHPKVYVLLIVSAFLIICSFIAPLVLTRISFDKAFNFKETGQIGDTIGGLMNPFIAIAGVIITGLAFYIQYKANQQQRDFFLKEQIANKDSLQKQIDNQNQQNKIQQFESQFYEMLRLHRENILEMKIEGYDFREETDPSGNRMLIEYEKTTEGRKIFVTMQTELECIINIYCQILPLNKEAFKKCYQIFFFGLDSFKPQNSDEHRVYSELKKARKRHERPQLNQITSNHTRKSFPGTNGLYFNYKPFSGHASRLGHYFRHLYLAVKSVVNSKDINAYEDKMKYLRLLRAQLSNHEQILLFYNWLSDYGASWENKDNQYFTEYCMIHNLWHSTIANDSFIQNNVDYLRNKEVQLRKSEMFEIDE